MAISNKHIVITGAASGIGLELLNQLTGNGNKILAVDINESGLEIISNKNPEIESLILDLTEPESVRAIFDWIQSNWKIVDYFFANAGFAKFGPWGETDMATLSKMLQINVASPIETAKVLKQTQSHSPCRLVVIASAMSFWPVPGYAAYASTKAALHQFVETLRSEGEGDWVTLVYPAATETDFFKSAGKEIPKAYPVQPVNIVVKKIIAGAAKGKRTIFPSKLFQVVMVANRIIPVFKPIYFFIERKKLRKWIGDKKGS